MDPRRPTSADVAALAGVSRTTVSFVLNDRDRAIIARPTRERVLEAARQLGYHPHAPARAAWPAAGATRSASSSASRPSRSPATRSSPRRCGAWRRRPGAAASGSSSSRSIAGEAAYGDLLRSRRVDGLVVSGPRFDDHGPRAAHPRRLPDRPPGLAARPATSPSVDVDNVAGARLAVEHLIGLGHRRIACITNAPLAYTAARERLDGYRGAARAPAIDADPSDSSRRAASTRRAATGRWRRCCRVRPTSTRSSSPATSSPSGPSAPIREAGLSVPDDVSVVGFDDIPLAAFFDPPLTTVRLPAYELGIAAGVRAARSHRRPTSARADAPADRAGRSLVDGAAARRRTAAPDH